MDDAHYEHIANEEVEAKADFVDDDAEEEDEPSLGQAICGTPAQRNRFTLHCQPRDRVFWQYTTTWYRNNRFIDTSGIHKSEYYIEMRGKAAHTVLLDSMYII